MQKKRNADLINERGYDNLPNITPQFRFELQAALAINQQVFGKPGPILPEALISQIFVHGREPLSDGQEQIVEVFFVFHRRTDNRSHKFGCHGWCSGAQGCSLPVEGEYIINRCKTERV